MFYNLELQRILNLPTVCQSIAHHQASSMADCQEAGLQPVWLICLLAAIKINNVVKYYSDY